MSKAVKICLIISALLFAIFVIQCIVSGFGVIIVTENSVTFPPSFGFAILFVYFAASIFVHNKLFAKYAPSKPYDKAGLKKILNISIVTAFAGLAGAGLLVKLLQLFATDLSGIWGAVWCVMAIVLLGIVSVGVFNVFLYRLKTNLF